MVFGKVKRFYVSWRTRNVVILVFIKKRFQCSVGISGVFLLYLHASCVCPFL